MLSTYANLILPVLSLLADSGAAAPLSARRAPAREQVDSPSIENHVGIGQNLSPRQFSSPLGAPPDDPSFEGSPDITYGGRLYGQSSGNTLFPSPSSAASSGAAVQETSTLSTLTTGTFAVPPSLTTSTLTLLEHVTTSTFAIAPADSATLPTSEPTFLTTSSTFVVFTTTLAVPVPQLVQSNKTAPFATSRTRQFSASTILTTTLSFPLPQATGFVTTTPRRTSATSSLASSQESVSSLESFSQSSVASFQPTGLTTTLITVTTTVSGTTSSLAPTVSSAPGSAGSLKLSLLNSLQSDNVHAYITGMDKNGHVVMVTASNSFYYPPNPQSKKPVLIKDNTAIKLGAHGSTTQITIPDYISAARVWFADGNLQFSVVSTANGPGLVEPTITNPSDASIGVNWGFVELTYNQEDGLFANLSFVDFVGLPLGMKLQTSSSGTQTARGLPQNAVSEVCRRLKTKGTQDGQPWQNLCSRGGKNGTLRVISPSNYMSSDAKAFAGYFDSYVDNIWNQYSSTPLTINTQNGGGKVECTTSGDKLSCKGDNRAYSKPTAKDILGCNSGPFAIQPSDNAVHLAVVPRLCAAFNRATLHLSKGNLQPSLPPSSYYAAQPYNVYSEVVHAVELDGKGYAFSYDDVAPSVAQGVAGAVSAPDPTMLTVYVGGST